MKYSYESKMINKTLVLISVFPLVFELWLMPPQTLS